MSNNLAGRPGFESVKPPSATAAEQQKQAEANQVILGKLQDLNKKLGGANTLDAMERENLAKLRKEGSGL